MKRDYGRVYVGMGYYIFVNADDVAMCEQGISNELVYFGTFLMVQLVFC